MPFTATGIDLEIIILSEVKSERGRQIYDITYMWNLKKKIQKSLCTKQKQTHRQNRVVVAMGEGEEGRDGLGVWG